MSLQCVYREKLEEDKEYQVVGDLSELQPKEESEPQVANDNKQQAAANNSSTANGEFSKFWCLSVGLSFSLSLSLSLGFIA